MQFIHLFCINTFHINLSNSGLIRTFKIREFLQEIPKNLCQSSLEIFFSAREDDDEIVGCTVLDSAPFMFSRKLCCLIELFLAAI